MNIARTSQYGQIVVYGSFTPEQEAECLRLRGKRFGSPEFYFNDGKRVRAMILSVFGQDLAPKPKRKFQL